MAGVRRPRPRGAGRSHPGQGRGRWPQLPGRRAVDRGRLAGVLPGQARAGAGASLPGVTDETADGKIYALNLFDVADRDEYLAYSRRSAAEVASHGGRVVALGRFRESVTGDISPRQVLILVEWESRAAFESYRQDPALADLHPHREQGSSAYVWHLFDRLDDLRPLLRA